MGTEAGERTYNKYLHALRKMAQPSSKPGDMVVEGFTFDMANKALIQTMGAMTIVAGALLLLGRPSTTAIILIFVTLFMMVSKDNIRIESSVPVIAREKPMRLENFCRDGSLIGAALILL